MAALNHSTIIKGFEKLVEEKDSEQFFFDFLKTLKFPAATIKRLREPNGSRNVASVSGDYGLAKQIYFHPAQEGEDLRNTVASLVCSQELQKHQIRFFLTTNFVDVVAYDKRVDDWTSFAFEDLRENYEFFLPLTGLYEKPLAYTSHPADVKACEKMGRLYDIIRTLNHYDASSLHELNVFLTRLLFCFFAEDTGIFPNPGQMTSAIESLTLADGSDLSDFFSRLFRILDAKPEDYIRQKETTVMSSFPYVNGGLFREQCRIPIMNAKARTLLLECGKLEWNQISPVIFGSMFQSVMDPEKRHEFSAHYTSEKNIFKVIRPLFLDELEYELNQILTIRDASLKRKRLNSYRNKLAQLRFLDPACGSGNFLVVTYREIKFLELKALTAELDMSVDKTRDVLVNWEIFSKISIDQFYGIEIEEFPVEIARVSMWLMEHVMHLRFGEKLGLVFPSIPLRDSAHIVCANALTTDWNQIVPVKDLNYILGNPPFGGIKSTTKTQKEEISLVFHGRNVGNLDYVACWFELAARYAEQNKNISIGFVATNSISQGEQVETLWNPLFQKGICINFAHQSFKWKNEAKNNAAVFCIIVGFSFINKNKKELFVYPTPNSEPSTQTVDYINGYLIHSSVDFIKSRSSSICSLPNMCYGNMPASKKLVLNEEEFAELKSTNPTLAKYVLKFHTAKFFLNNTRRYCIWLYGVPEDVANQIPGIENLKTSILAERTDPKTGRLRQHYVGTPPLLFHQITQPMNCSCLLIPRHSSENRLYIPMGFIPAGEIIGDSCQVVANASLYHFGILESRMHMAWMRTVCGRLKSDYRYSRDLCYNTFPWPKVSENQRELISNLASNILMTREFYPDMTLADLYDPDKMPDDLRKAHTELDFAVDKLYRNAPFENDEARLRHLFTRYEKLIESESNVEPNEE